MFGRFSRRNFSNKLDLFQATCSIITRFQIQYSQQIIFFEMAEQARVLHFTRLKWLCSYKHPDLMTAFVSYEENEVLWILSHNRHCLDEKVRLNSKIKKSVSLLKKGLLWGRRQGLYERISIVMTTSRKPSQYCLLVNSKSFLYLFYIVTNTHTHTHKHTHTHTHTHTHIYIYIYIYM
jgi:hypothetical protein